MPTRQRVECACGEGRRPLFHGWRNLDRRSFLKATVFGATVRIAAARSLAPGAVALAGEAKADKAKSKKGDPSKSLQGARCPVTGENVSKEAALDYKGGRIYFCCAACIDKFKADKAKYESRANVQLVVTGQVRQIQCPLTGGEFDPEIQVIVCGVQVCLCSEECRDEVKRAAPSKQIGLVFGKGFNKAFAMKRTKAASSSSAAEPAGDEWRCSACGYVHVGSEPPATCPACGATSYSFMRVRKTPKAAESPKR